MPDGITYTPDYDEAVEFSISVDCECYCDLDPVRDAICQQSDLNGALAWAAPRAPTPNDVGSGADLVLIVSDIASFPAATARSFEYQEQGQSHISICLQDGDAVLSEEIPGLLLESSQLAAGLASLSHAVFAPVIPQGMVCVDWCDTRHLLNLEGQIVMGKAYGSRPDLVIESAMMQMRMHAIQRPILGVQASILCSPVKLAPRYAHDLLRACRATAMEDATCIVAAPWVDWPDVDYYEVRLFAKVECCSGKETRIVARRGSRR